jgi:hypothetical protein
MILDILQRYTEIIRDYNVIKFNLTGESYQLILQVNLIDGSILHVRDYLFLDGLRKYSFHWETPTHECIVRWDNAPHHQIMDTFPYHCHRRKDKSIEACPPINLDKVLNSISIEIKTQLGKE